MRKAFQIAIYLVFFLVTVSISFAEDFEQSLRQLKKPIDVVDADLYRDGGTVGIYLKDAANHSFQFCLDGQFYSETRGYFLLGVVHPSEGGLRVDKDSDTEKYLIEILENCLEKDPDNHRGMNLAIGLILGEVKGVAKKEAEPQVPLTREQIILMAKERCQGDCQPPEVIETPEAFEITFFCDRLHYGRSQSTKYVFIFEKFTQMIVNTHFSVQ